LPSPVCAIRCTAPIRRCPVSPPDELRTKLRPASDPLVFGVIPQALVNAHRLTSIGPAIARAGLSLASSVSEALLELLIAAALTPPRLSELAHALQVPAPQAAIEQADRPPRRRRQSRARAKDLVFAQTALVAFETRVRDFFVREEWLDAQALEALAGTTRKWSIPPGEWLDHARVTVRVGDRRRLRA